MLGRRLLRSAVSRLLPPGQIVGIGPIGVCRNSDTLLIGPKARLVAQTVGDVVAEPETEMPSSVHDDWAILHPAETITRSGPRFIYGTSYREEPLPRDLAPEKLREYVSRSGWCHEIDLGNGVITAAGMRTRSDIVRTWESFGLANLSGKSVLDIGGVDGGYAFQAEQSGASQVAVLDHYLWSTDAEEYGRIYSEYVESGKTPPAPHESNAWHPDTLPSRWRFDAAKRALGSDVRPIVLDFMDCDLAEIGAWDIV